MAERFGRRRFLGRSAQYAALGGLVMAPRCAAGAAMATWRRRRRPAAADHGQPAHDARQRVLADRERPRAGVGHARAVQLPRLPEPGHARRVRGGLRGDDRILDVRHRGTAARRAGERIVHVRRGRGRDHAQSAAPGGRQPDPAAEPRLPDELRQRAARAAGPVLRPRLEVHDPVHRLHHRHRLPPGRPRRLAVHRRRLVEGPVGSHVPGLRRGHRRRPRGAHAGDVLPRRVRHQHRRPGDHRPGRERPARPDRSDQRQTRHPRLPEDPRRHVARQPGLERRHARRAAVPARGHRRRTCSGTGRQSGPRWPTTSR